MTDTTTTPDATPQIGTVEQILNAPSDLVHEIVDVPEFGCAVKIRSLTAAQSAKVRQAGIVGVGDKARLDFAALEKAQFLHGVAEPKFRPEDVNVLHHRSGPGFQRVIKAVDRISGTDPKSLKETLESFQAGGGDERPTD